MSADINTTAPALPIRLKGLSKVFGPQPHQAMQRVHQGVSKDSLRDEFGHVLGLNQIDLDVPAGALQVIMGLSGSGKSTLIRHINRLIEPTEGEVWVGDVPVMQLNHRELLAHRRVTTSMVFQKFALMPHLTNLENVSFGLEILGIPAKVRRNTCRQWLDRVGLAGYESSYPHELSGGMQQRVGLARALAVNTPILLMDEAFSALDPLIRNDMQDLLLELQQEQGKTVVFITHDLDEALKLGEHIAILRDGDIVQKGTPADIVLKPESDYVQNFVRSVNRGKVIRCKSLVKPIAQSTDNSMKLNSETNLEQAIAQLNETSETVARVINKRGKTLGEVNLQDLINVWVAPS